MLVAIILANLVFMLSLLIDDEHQTGPSQSDGLSVMLLLVTSIAMMLGRGLDESHPRRSPRYSSDGSFPTIEGLLSFVLGR
jgi:hypothetical protein